MFDGSFAAREISSRDVDQVCDLDATVVNRLRAQRWVATGFDGLGDFALVDEELDKPGPGEVTIAVRAAGVNPADLKHVRRESDSTLLPLPIGYEVSGTVEAVGPQVDSVDIGGDVLAFRVRGGYATALNVSADKVFAKPASLTFDEAAGLLLAGCTAADMLRAASLDRDETAALHGASGAVGVAVLQLARLRGIRVVGTSSPAGFDRIREFGGVPVSYDGPGLADHIREAAEPFGIQAALDASGTDDAIDASLELVDDRSRIVTIAAPRRAAADGFIALGGAQPESQLFRDSVRSNLIRLAGQGDLVVPVARTFALEDAVEALRLVAGGHAGGKVVLTT